jgi:hypothetical protein
VETSCEVALHQELALENATRPSIQDVEDRVAVSTTPTTILPSGDHEGRKTQESFSVAACAG